MPLILLSTLTTSLCVGLIVALSLQSHAQEETLNMEDPQVYEQVRDHVTIPQEKEEEEDEGKDEEGDEEGTTEGESETGNALPPHSDSEGSSQKESYGMKSVQIAVDRAKLRASFEDPSLHGTTPDFQTLQPFLSVEGKQIHTQEELEAIADRKISSFGAFSPTPEKSHSPIQFQ
jgi:hypothetical protein